MNNQDLTIPASACRECHQIRDTKGKFNLKGICLYCGHLVCNQCITAHIIMDKLAGKSIAFTGKTRSE